MATNKDKLIAGAQKLVEKNQFEKAIKEYLKVVAEDDKDVRIWLKIGDLYAKLGKKSEAAETYSKVAQFYSDQGFYLKAVAVYKQILKIEPRLVDVNHKLAELYKQLGLLSDAMQQYEAVAAFYHREGKTREALAALKQIVELDPETVANRIKLAELYSKEQMAREAIDEFSKAAEQLRQAGRVDDFMKVAERLLFHSPDNRPVTKELAGLYIEKGDPRRALPKLQICFKADPRDTEVLSLLARAFEALDQRQKSVSVLKELARILGENGDNRARDATWRKIMQLAPGDPDAEAALSSPGRARSQPAIEPPELTGQSPTPSTRNATGSAVAIGRISPTNATGGRPVQMSASGRVQALRDEPPAPEPNAPKARTWDGPTVGRGERERDRGPQRDKEDNNSKGFEVPDDSMRNAAGAEEEIARILNETDVYIKYNLHAKAIEHLQRAFERNPRHIGAREKLKALFLILGKKDEAVLELWSLVESAEPGRKRRYLREILEIDPNNARAADELGEKLAPSVGALTSSLDDRDGDDYASIQRDPEGTGGSEMLDVDDLEELEDDDLAAPPDSSPSLFADAFAADEAERRGHGVDRRRGAPIEIEDSDEDDELIPVVVEQEREPEPAEPEEVEDRFGFDHDAAPVEDRFGFDGKEEESTLPPTFGEGLDLSEDTAPSREELEPEPTPPPARPRRESSHSVAPAHAAARPGAREPSHAAGRLPAPGPSKKRNAAEEELDADVHTRFDDQPLKFDHAALFGSHSSDEVDEADLPPMSSIPGGTGTRTQQAPKADEFEDDDLASPNNRPVTRTQLTPAGVLDGGESGPIGTTLEDELDEADFFVQQNLFDEARVILENLLSKHQGHPLVTAKLRDLEAMERAVAAPEPSEAHEVRPGMSAEMDADLPDDLPGDVNATATAGNPAGTFEMTRKGVIEKGVTAEDFETHYDLGIAYKEMGLLDDAVNEFRIVMKDPAREVQCHLMIGLCYLEKGLQTDAIGQFKKGLYVEGITEREALSMYFELGQAYERLTDPREALYYYEKVIKRDPNFRDVEKRVEALRHGGTVTPSLPQGNSDDVDAAFDTLLGKDL